MDKESLDPRVHRLVASLYGELTEDEERELQEEMENSPELRGDLEELRAARVFLGDWAGEEPEPGSIFVTQPSLWTSEQPANSPWARLRRWMAHLMPVPAWGFGFATVLLVGLLLAGFRVDRVDNGIAFRFGPENNIETALLAGTSGGSRVSGGDPANPGGTITTLDGTVEALPVAATGPYVTQGQLREQHGQIIEQMTALLGDYEQRRNGELAYILQTFYQEIAGQQNMAITELQSQIEGVGLGLMAEQSRTNERLETLVDDDGTLKTTQSSPQERGDQ